MRIDAWRGQHGYTVEASLKDEGIDGRLSVLVAEDEAPDVPAALDASRKYIDDWASRLRGPKAV